MTPYAMSAHLTLDLAWLWLFLRGGRAGHAGAAATGFLACGLHQIVFHPLFVAPFLLHLAVARRLRLLAFYVVSYAAIGLFWASYWRLALGGAALPPDAAAGAGTPTFLRGALAILALPTLSGLGDMAKNLLRFVAWQNPLGLPLAVLGTAVAWRQASVLRPLALGIALTVAVVFLLLPYQGHGWGYRYLHGVIGNVALLGAAGWVAAIPAGRPDRPASSLLVRSVLCTLLILVPMRVVQVTAFVWPYAESYAAIRDAKQDVVIVDPLGIGFGIDFVRNDPFLHRPPKVLSLASLEEPQLRALCGRGPVGLFDRRDAAAHGLPTGEATGALADLVAGRRALMAELGCGMRLGE